MGDNMRRICLFCETWSSGGIESFLTNILTNLDKSDIEVDIVAACIKKSIFTSRLTRCGVCFYELSGNRNHVIKNKKIFLEIMKKRTYDVIHLNTFHGGALYYLLLAKKMGIPVRIAHSHNVGLRRGKHYWLKMMIHKWACRHFIVNATDFWACSKAAADFMFPQGVPYCLIPNGFDVERFRFNATYRNMVRRRLKIKDEIIVGNVGRLCYQKNQIFLLHIFAEFLNMQPNGRLLLVGEGEDQLKLEDEASLLRIKDKVIFWGATSHVEQLYWAMDVFIFPSIFEGLGIAAVEAQASGLPMVCSDRIPKEACILQSVEKIPLNSAPDKWAEASVISLKKVFARETCADAVRKGGFDIVDVIKIVANTYLGK